MKKFALILSVFLTACLLFVSCELVSEKPAKGKLYVVAIGDNFVNQPGFNPIKSCENDADALCQVFDYLGKKAGMETVIFNCSAGRFEAFEAALAEVRSKATDNDMTVIFVSTHGSNTIKNTVSYSTETDAKALFYLEKTDGSVMGVYDAGLKNYCSYIKGKVLILADFCFSGSLVAQDYFTYNSANYSGSNALSLLFDGTPATGSNRVFALCASTYYEYSWANYPLSIFTKYLLRGLGMSNYNPSTKQITMSSGIPVANGGRIILSDLYKYVYNNSTSSSLEGSHTQTPQMNTGANDLILFSF